MNTKFLKQLKSTLPDQSWPWVIAALRQDEQIWVTLQEVDTFTSPPSETEQNPECWNPARIAFMALQHEVPTPASALSLGLRQRAFRTYEGITQKHYVQVIETVPIIQSAMLAIALRERLRLTGKWDNIAEELSLSPYDVWRTPLACLYGLIEEPLELLRSLMIPGAPAGIYNLAFHSLLSNPLPPEKLFSYLVKLVKNLPAPDKNNALQQLYLHRPALAGEIARQVFNPSEPDVDEDPLVDLVNQCHRVKMSVLATDSAQAEQAKKYALDDIRKIQARLAVQNAQSCDIPLDSLQKAFELAPEEPSFRSKLALAYLENNNIAEASAVLDPSEVHDIPGLLYASARLAQSSGDVDRSRKLACRALEKIEALQTENNTRLFEPDSYAKQLAQFFLQQNAPAEAARAASIAARERPYDPSRLILLGKAQTAAGKHIQAAESYQWAVLLDPQLFELHRILAKSLEAAGDWAFALEERKTMAASPTSSVDDQYALADCALHNNQTSYAADLCRVMLSKDPDDGMAHTLLGEALAAVGDLTAADIHFTQASELAPGLSRPWLALARSQTQRNQGDKALETLKIAAQAIPDSADVHLALGESYHALNLLTQALEEFQRAAEIDPRSVPIALCYGQTLYQLGHLPQAHDILQKAHKQEPANLMVASAYARVLMEQDDPLTALPALETVVSSDPLDPEPYIDFARALLLTRGDAAKAIKSLRRALELLPDHYQAQALLAEALAVNTDYEASLRAYQNALETPLAQNTEWRAKLSYGLGGVALHLGQTEIAITASLEANHLDPQNYRPQCQLAEAYQVAGLIPDACQAANEALRLAGDDIKVMIWYVEKILELSDKNPTSAASQQQAQTSEMRKKALQILARAAEIAPDQPEVFLKIARIQSQCGDISSASMNLRRIAAIKAARLEELDQAAESLLSLKDAEGAIQCYSQALETEQYQAVRKDIKISILSKLAYAYKNANNPQAALKAIENAISLSPDGIVLSCDKAQLLHMMGQSESALNFLEDTISHYQDARLYYTASVIYQAAGKLVEALEHAVAGAHLPVPTEKDETKSERARCTLQAAELACSMLQPELANQILHDQQILTQDPDESDASQSILLAELALENGDDIDASTNMVKVTQDIDTNLPRFQALQARLLARRGDYQSAIAQFQAILQNLGEVEPKGQGVQKVGNEDTNLSSSAFYSGPLIPPATLYPLITTAVELNLWTIALQLAQKAVYFAPSEPLAHLNLAQVLVARAEFQYLCNDANMVSHAPGVVALSEGTCRAFEQAIEEAVSICEGISDKLHTNTVPASLEKWQRRGNAVFSPTVESATLFSEWAERKNHPENIAASIAVLRRLSINNVKQDVDINQRSGAILTQIALTLTGKNPAEAIKALQMAILNEPARTTHNAIRHYLLARLAHTLHIPAASPAIQTALAILPDEPRWCALAAKITLSNGDKATAINFMDQAIQLEPRHVDHHLALGQLFLQYAEDNHVAEAQQAVKSLERACRLAPEHPEAWLLLARAHRVAGNLDQAAAAAEQSTTLGPEISASHLIQAEIALQSGKPQIAHDHAQTALHLQPESQQAAMVLSRALQALNRPGEALAVIDKSFPVSEHTIPLTIERIQLLRKSQGAQAALATASELAQLNPDDAIVLAILAEIQADAGQEDTAIRTAQKAILLGEGLPSSQQSNLHLLLGQLLRRTGQLDQAVHHLDEVIRLAPDKIEAFLELGRTHQDRRQQAQALQMYRRAATINPQDPRPYLQAGLALKDGKDYIEAESMLRRAADLEPNDPTIRRQLAAVIAINLVHNPHRPIQIETV